MLIFVSQVMQNRIFLKNFKSQNLGQFLRFCPEFLHVISIFIQVQTLNGVSANSFIDFLTWVPPHTQNYLAL